MTSDEAHLSKKPQSTNLLKKFIVITKKIISSKNTFKLTVFLLTFVFLGLCGYSLNNFKPNRNIIFSFKNDINKLEVMTGNSSIKYSKEVILQNEKIFSEIEKLRKENEQLIKINKELAEDNIALQNSLKLAASVGIKPQNFTKFEGITRGEVERGEYVGSFLGTAYTPSIEECGNNKGITNSGIPIIPGVSIAVDTKYWPIGTVFYIRGLGYALAMDTGGAIKGKYRFDFAVFDKKFADKLGIRKWDMYVIHYGSGKISNIRF